MSLQHCFDLVDVDITFCSGINQVGFLRGKEYHRDPESIHCIFGFAHETLQFIPFNSVAFDMDTVCHSKNLSNIVHFYYGLLWNSWNRVLL